jgi:hypothetical protein
MKLFEDGIEVSLGLLALLFSGFGIFAQAEVLLPSWAQLIPHFGGLAFAVWLVIHHTTVTIPKMQAEHKAERLEAEAQFIKALEEKRKAYQDQLAYERNYFREHMEKLSCKWNHDDHKN